MKIYHIVLPDVWAAQRPEVAYQADSLESEGFIHCSFDEQLDAVLDRYYPNAGQVLILEIETDKLTSKFVAEPSTNDEIYPHIYGPINAEAIDGVTSRRLD